MRIFFIIVLLSPLFSTVHASIVKSFDLSGFDGSGTNVTVFDDLIATISFTDSTDFTSVINSDILSLQFDFNGITSFSTSIISYNVHDLFSVSSGLVYLSIGNTGNEGYLVSPGNEMQLGIGSYKSVWAGWHQYEHSSVYPFTVAEVGSRNVPEPSILALLGLGIVSLGFSRRRKLQG